MKKINYTLQKVKGSHLNSIPFECDEGYWPFICIPHLETFTLISIEKHALACFLQNIKKLQELWFNLIYLHRAKTAQKYQEKKRLQSVIDSSGKCDQTVYMVFRKTESHGNNIETESVASNSRPFIMHSNWLNVSYQFREPGMPLFAHLYFSASIFAFWYLQKQKLLFLIGFIVVKYNWLQKLLIVSVLNCFFFSLALCFISQFIF